MELAYPLETFRLDFDRHVEFLKNCTVDQVPIYLITDPVGMEKLHGPGTTHTEIAACFSDQVAEVRAQGLKIDVVYAAGAMALTVLESPEQQAEFEFICRASAEQGMRVVSASFPNPAREACDDSWTEAVVGGYRWMAERAEAHGLLLASHLGTARGRRLFTATDVEELLDQIDRPNNGLLFCFGNAGLSDLDVPAQIRRFGGRIFAAHVRQIKLTPEGGEIEAPMTDGLLDLPACLRALREVGYTGILHPEHFPTFSTALPSDQRDLWPLPAEPDGPTLAWTLGCLRGMLEDGR